MIKKITTLLLLFATTCIPVFGSITDLDISDEPELHTKGDARSSIVSIEAIASGDELTVDINRYLGYVQVTVCALDGSGTTYNTYFINGHSSFTMDFTGYNAGCYSISIGLQNGTVYSGSFRIE